MSTRPFLRLLLAVVTLLAFQPLASVAAVDESPDNERWRAVRQSVFGDKPIANDTAGLLTLETPARAADAAIVPIAIRTALTQTPQRYIRKLYLVIDRNPSPLGATFSFTPQSGRAGIETRVRIEEYTHVRAIAEMNDGSLLMQVRFVKAAGGCSAPAGKDLAAAMASIGRMKLRVDETPTPGTPTLVQLSVSHPNVSGLAIDQLTRLAPMPRYVRTIAISYGGKPVMSADVDFTISENPSLRFYFVPEGDGELKAQIVDTEEKKFETAVAVKTGPRAGG
jgi:sulfur-oxidizing protein SoxY